MPKEPDGLAYAMEEALSSGRLALSKAADDFVREMYATAAQIMDGVISPKAGALAFDTLGENLLRASQSKEAAQAFVSLIMRHVVEVAQGSAPTEGDVEWLSREKARFVEAAHA